MPRNVVIPIKVGDHGELLLFDERSVTGAFRPGSRMTLRCELASIQDAPLYRFYDNHNETVEVARPDDELMLGLQAHLVSLDGHQKLLGASAQEIVSPFVFARVTLKEPLSIHWERGRLPRLSSCKCEAVGLGIEADSLNQIYTRLSEKFETERTTHTANVFDRAWLKNKDKWVKLSVARDAIFGSTEPVAPYVSRKQRKAGSK
ncbi:MAG: hypothetical protein SGI92_17325 [Bryobacteraceae bacterium]|nr:hypothetical protein [Bryobacteraceae bacterium]